MTPRFRPGAAVARAARWSALAALALVLVACSSTGEKKKPRDRSDVPLPDRIDRQDSEQDLSDRMSDLLSARQLYEKAHQTLMSADFKVAIDRFDKVISRFPFSEYATQAALEKLYAQYRSSQPDDATIGADRFLREHPRHPNADYVQYLKGLIDFSRDQSLSDYLPVDTTKRDVGNAERAFEDFALLVRRYPDSRYYSDARLRMIYLRNRIASHEMAIVNYYIKRGAWVAAAKRAEDLIQNYPGAPATADALLALRTCYTDLNLKAELHDVNALITANQASIKAARSGDRQAAPEPTRVDASAPPPPAPGKGTVGTVKSGLDTLDQSYTVDGRSSTRKTTPDEAMAHGGTEGAVDVITLPSATAANAAPTATTPPAVAGTASPAAPSAPKQGFWQRIKGFFGIGQTAPSPTPGASATSAKP